MNNDSPELRLVEGEAAGRARSARKRVRRSELIAELVGETGLLQPDQLENVRTRAAGGSFSQALRDEGLATALGVARRLAEQYHLPLVDLAEAGIDPEASKLIALSVLERVGADPVRLRGRHAEGRDHRSAERAGPRPAPARDAPLGRVLRRREHRRPDRGQAPDARLGGAERGPRRGRGRARPPSTNGEGDDLEADDGISEAPLVRLVNSIIFQAAEEGASDVHFEPQEDALVVRFRIDGVLRVVQRIPMRLTAGVTTRLKVLAKLDIAERRKPQDGRITLNAAAAGRMLDIRVATLPTVEGESVTMRLLDKSRSAPTLSELGLSDEMRDAARGHRLQAYGSAARHRADRLGEVDDALRRARRDQPARDQHHHSRRGSGGVSPQRDQPGADQPARQA